MNGMFNLNLNDISKALVMAVLTGAILPIAAIIQTPGFSVLTVNWGQVGILALNGAIIGFTAYIIKNFFSDANGAVLGKIGGNTNGQS